MDSRDFLDWALDNSRTGEERFTIERLVEEQLSFWHVKHQTGHYSSWQFEYERKRQRYLNPGYEPSYLREDLERAWEVLAERKLWHRFGSYQDRPLRDLQVLRFFPHLESLSLGFEGTDCSPLADLPRLRGLKFSSLVCEDLRPITRCTGLRELELRFGRGWPELTGLEQLQHLEQLELSGNLLALPPGLVWPKVRRAILRCQPLALRSVRELPQVPNCELLMLAGVERLDGIEAWPKLRNLTIEGVVRDFTPLTALRELTWFHQAGAEPLDVAPLAQLPKLQVIGFKTSHDFAIDKVRPRDFAPLTDAPLLRELHVEGCPPVEAEVKTLNALLLPWDDVFLAATPRPLPPLRMIIAPMEKQPRRPDIQFDPGESDLVDEGLRGCEGRWVGRFVTRLISERLGQNDWGHAEGHGKERSVFVTIQSFAVVEKLPVILASLREALSRLRGDYAAQFMIALIAPPPKPTPAQLALKEKFQAERDQEAQEEYQREHREYLDRLHRYELKRQAGEEVSPNEFAPPPSQPETEAAAAEPEVDWEHDANSGDESDGTVATEAEAKDDAAGLELDDAHPLADKYGLLGKLSLSEVWFLPHHRDIAIYLMGQQPDEEIK
jgi:hypothetical protein